MPNEATTGGLCDVAISATWSNLIHIAILEPVHDVIQFRNSQVAIAGLLHQRSLLKPNHYVSQSTCSKVRVAVRAGRHERIMAERGYYNTLLDASQRSGQCKRKHPSGKKPLALRDRAIRIVKLLLVVLGSGTGPV